MEANSKVWVIVLAAGEGSRLHSLTNVGNGGPVPKQFCAFVPDKPPATRLNGKGGSFRACRPISMLESTLDRAARIAPPERTVAIVATSHRRWWEGGMPTLPHDNIIVQPSNRGTAPGILLPLLHVLMRDVNASVLILPSDHYVRDEPVMDDAVRGALAFSEKNPDRLTLLGITPFSPDEGYGWIVPARNGEAAGSDVGSFVEKPPREIADRLMRSGALWNSFMMVGAVRTFMGLFEGALPDLLSRFTSVFEEGMDARRLQGLYENLPTLDFSRHLLERSVDQLSMHAVPDCGWSDLGTPKRILEVGGRVVLPEELDDWEFPIEEEFEIASEGMPSYPGA